MDRYSFGTFLAEDFNHAALQVCRDIANLECNDPQPVVLTGETGCGKTHLLYAIVNRIRATSPDAGIAYITGDDFPDEVRDLVQNPGPVEDADHAVLLVDNLEGFTRDQELLEAVVRIFLTHGHAVVVATSVHPGRIQHLPDTLQQTLLDGMMVTLLPSEAHRENEKVSALIPAEAGISDTVPTMAEQDDSLLLELRSELDSVRASRGDAQEKLSAVEAELAELKGDANSRESDVHAENPTVSELKTELEHLKGENALLAVAQKEVVPLRDKLKRVQGECDRLEVELQSKPTGSVDDVSPPPHAVREDARLLLRRAEDLLSAMQKNRLDITDAQRKQVIQLEEIRSLGQTLNEPVGASAVIHSLDAQLTELSDTTETLRLAIVQLFSDTDFNSDVNRPWSSTSSCPELSKALPAFGAHLRENRIDLMEKITESVDQLEQTRQELHDARHETKHFTHLVEERDLMVKDLKTSLDMLEVEAGKMLEAANEKIGLLSQDLEAQKSDTDKQRHQHEDIVDTLTKLLSTMDPSSELDTVPETQEENQEETPPASLASNITSFEEIAALADAIDTVDAEPEAEDTPEAESTVEMDEVLDEEAVEDVLTEDVGIEPDTQQHDDQPDPEYDTPKSDNTVHFEDSRQSPEPPTSPGLHHVEELERDLSRLPDDQHGTGSSDQKNQTA